MRLSIIIPVYNVEPYIRRCLESIVRQIDASDEIILVDDGSTDESGLVCDEYSDGKSVRVIHKSNGGLSDARNKGIDQASGDYLVFIDSDDYVSDDFIGIIKSVLSECQYDIVNFGYNIVNPKGEVVSTHCLPQSQALDPREALTEILLDRSINNFAWANAYKKNLFDNVKYPFGVLYEDKYTTYRTFASASSVYHIAAPLYNYLVREGSICNSGSGDRRLKGAFDNIGGLIQQRQFAKIHSLHPCESNLSERIRRCGISLCRFLYKNNSEDEIKRLREMLAPDFPKEETGGEFNLFLYHPSVYKFLMWIYRLIK